MEYLYLKNTTFDTLIVQCYNGRLRIKVYHVKIYTEREICISMDLMS